MEGPDMTVEVAAPFQSLRFYGFHFFIHYNFSKFWLNLFTYPLFPYMTVEVAAPFQSLRFYGFHFFIHYNFSKFWLNLFTYPLFPYNLRGD